MCVPLLALMIQLCVIMFFAEWSVIVMHIHQADGDDPDYPCTMVKQQPIDDIVTAAMLVVESRETGEIGTTRHSCHEILQHLVHPVFFDIATDGSKYGIFGCLPWELLHLCSMRHSH